MRGTGIKVEHHGKLRAVLCLVRFENAERVTYSLNATKQHPGLYVEDLQDNAPKGIGSTNRGSGGGKNEVRTNPGDLPVVSGATPLITTKLRSSRIDVLKC